MEATGRDADEATAALEPWICDTLLSNHSVAEVAARRIQIRPTGRKGE